MLFGVSLFFLSMVAPMLDGPLERLLGHMGLAFGKISEKNGNFVRHLHFEVGDGSKSMKHGYGNLDAVPVLGTAGVRVQPRYRCMRTPSVPNFFRKKKIPSTGRLWVGYGRG